MSVTSDAPTSFSESKIINLAPKSNMLKWFNTNEVSLHSEQALAGLDI